MHMARFCPRCGLPVQASFVFCPKCGASLPKLSDEHESSDLPVQNRSSAPQPNIPNLHRRRTALWQVRKSRSAAAIRISRLPQHWFLWAFHILRRYMKKITMIILLIGMRFLSIMIIWESPFEQIQKYSGMIIPLFLWDRERLSAA